MSGIVAFAAANDPERAVGIVNDTPQALGAEYDNLRAALSSGVAQDPAAALALAVSLWRFWLARGHFSEGSRWLAATLAAAPEPTATRARALLCAASMELRRGGPVGPQLDLGAEAISIMRAVGDDRALAQTLHLAGMLAWVVEDGWQRAAELVEEGRVLAATAADVPAVANATHTLGVIALARGARAQAEEHFAAVLGDARRSGSGPAAVLLGPDARLLLGAQPCRAASAAVHRDRAAVPPGR